METTTPLRLWGAAHAQARAAEEAAARRGPDADALSSRARALREHADRLHREAYAALGEKEPDGPR